MRCANGDRYFEIARTLGVNTLSAIFMLDVAEKVAPFADKHKIYESTWTSGITVPPDPMRYIGENHEHISHVHLQDRLKDHGPIVPNTASAHSRNRGVAFLVLIRSVEATPGPLYSTQSICALLPD
jgi:hypothetical protein